eukprot:CAMPEP_0115510724 /NCGR_PEP_ID=MMETSP0271-20121206/73578_1 /TAXON_ID=71861 /ORGANISM="Scrippsiella trochoidea, Strain CCMP3099" /LENGTH=87 /DNA_ID=CAMNT_0002940733 /DNA_START=183 /DNA_END=443 /DNA_ORIENTATION=+
MPPHGKQGGTSSTGRTGLSIAPVGSRKSNSCDVSEESDRSICHTLPLQQAGAAGARAHPATSSEPRLQLGVRADDGLRHLGDLLRLA